MESAFSIVADRSPVVASAIHAGHALRPEIAAVMALDDGTRRREEDPATDRMLAISPAQVRVTRSRFEVDLNRRRDEAVYAGPGAAWGLRPWDRPLDADLVERSMHIHDAFYAELGAHLDSLADRGPFVVLDVHSYNHRRDGPDRPPAPPADNPEVNLGTGSVDRERWSSLVDRFLDDLAHQEVDGHRVDARENVRFRGGHLARWVNDRYPGVGCALAIELKKTFMDEWTGAVDDRHVDQLRDALGATVPGLLDSIDAGAP